MKLLTKCNNVGVALCDKDTNKAYIVILQGAKQVKTYKDDKKYVLDVFRDWVKLNAWNSHVEVSRLRLDLLQIGV